MLKVINNETFSKLIDESKGLLSHNPDKKDLIELRYVGSIGEEHYYIPKPKVMLKTSE